MSYEDLDDPLEGVLERLGVPQRGTLQAVGSDGLTADKWGDLIYLWAESWLNQDKAGGLNGK